MPKPGMHTGNETDSELNFAMSAKALPLFNAVKKFIAEEVEPMAAKFYALGENRDDRWQYAPGQLELLEGVKSKAKAQGLWNFFLPNAETGEGLSNLDYAYIAVELGKSPLASESLNCSAPDTGNMEVLERVGTPEQKEKWLKPLMNGEIRSAYVMTEPDVASSDAKNLQCLAVLDGDEWVINGQKVWTTQGHHADYCFLLTRTDPDAPKHKGISYLLVPMRQPGVEVRGIVQPDGTAEFCEVFFDNARCPKDNVVGGINNGWIVTNSTLAFERGMSATTGYRRFEAEYKAMVRGAKENGRINDPEIRQRLMQYYTKIQILKINGLRSLSTTLMEKKDPSMAALGASNKMFWTEMHQRAMELALDISGANAMLVDYAMGDGNWPGTSRDKRRDGYPVSGMMSSFFFSRSETIWGGTSQIQRNIVGERVLGLPKEPSSK